jgi:hypothetical protein
MRYNGHSRERATEREMAIETSEPHHRNPMIGKKSANATKFLRITILAAPASRAAIGNARR